MSQGKLHTFVSLLKDVDVIEIPVIQRDYAQGRAEAADIRDSFLAAIAKAVKEKGPPLDLDFVYGSVVHEGLRTLGVLDGQQRLTTLFLLHWYLAALDGELEHFRQNWVTPDDGRSRFTYSTRPSAAEFFQALTTNDFDVSGSDDEAISELIIDSKWFFDHWGRDPTVRSCLVMLDAIQKKFGSTKDIYQAMVQEERVFFHYLELRDFGLSDDLYIKMNARGKVLTPFENFKAWIVERIAGETWAGEFTLKLDQRWVDYFWTMAGRCGGDGFDELFLRFLYVSAYFDVCQRIDGFWTSKKAEREWLQRLRDARGYIPLRDFDVNASFGVVQLAAVQKVLDYLTGEHREMFVDVLKDALQLRADYDDLLRLYAIVAFVLSAEVHQLDKASHEACFKKWSRVTSNLIKNTRIDEPSAAVSAVKGLTTLARHAASLYQALAKEAPSGLGFTRDQVEEESQKAALILQDQEWESLLIQAESHWYLQGRVRFLLKLSTSASQEPDKDRFRKYLLAVNRVLTENILKSQEFVLQRALLSLYDFLPPASGENHTFCGPNASRYRDRQENWLPVFEDVRFHKLLDVIEIEKDGLMSLRQLIDKCTTSGWQGLMVADPELFIYCEKRFIRKFGATILLLSKSRLSGYFAEVRSYSLYLKLKRQLSAGLLPDLKDLEYKFVYGDDYPSIYVRTDADYSISYRDGEWICLSGGQAHAQMPESIAQIAARVT